MNVLSYFFFKLTTKENTQNTYEIMSFEKCSEITTSKIHDNHNEESSVKQEYICKEELNLEWQEDEFCEQGSNNLLVEEPMNVDYFNNYTNTFCDSIEGKIFKNNKVHDIMKDLSNKEHHEPKNALHNAFVVIERLPDHVMKKFCLDKENIYPKIQSTPYVKDSRRKFYDIFCEHCKKIVKYDSKSISCLECKKAVVFECKICNKRFKSDSGLGYHLKIACQSQGNYYQCAGCPYKSIFKRCVIMHMQLLHKNLSISDMKIMASQDLQKDFENLEYLHKCLNCGKQFKSVLYLNGHFKTCGNFKRQVALIGMDDLEKGTPTSSNSEDHFQEQDLTSDKLLLIKWAKHHCKKCNKRTILNVRNSRECKECKSILLFECSKCEKHYDSTRSIIRHLKSTCTIGEVHFCSKCNYQSSIKACLHAHYKRVHESAPAECPKCKNILKNKHSLNKHLQSCGKESDPCSGRTISCPKCGVKLKNKRSLSRHMRKCGAEPRFQCQLCTYKSHSKYHIGRHMKFRHFKDMTKYPDCPKCGVKLDSKPCKYAHLRYCGTSKRRFECDHCPFMFGRKYSLQLHIIRRHLHNNDEGDESDVDVV